MAPLPGRRSAFAIYKEKAAIYPEAVTETQETEVAADKKPPTKSGRNQGTKRKSNQAESGQNKKSNVNEAGPSHASDNDVHDHNDHPKKKRGRPAKVKANQNGSQTIPDPDTDSSSDEDLQQKRSKLAEPKKLIFGKSRSLSVVHSQSDDDANPCDNPPCGNEVADSIFTWLISPLTPKDFYENIFEEKPYYIKRENKQYFEGLYSSKDFEKILKENSVKIGVEMDVTKYVGGERKPFETGEVLTPNIVWEAFSDDYTLRMRNPQAYHKGLWKTCSLLQEYFCSSVGANMYLTPPNTQGFPPHWDDIDAFILQIEGKKHWKVYQPKTKADMLPRFPSADLNEEDLPDPCLEIDVEPGDLLYIPRGFVHQAYATDEHSLHLTISTNQLNTWADFFEKALPNMIKTAASKSVALRRTIPKDFYEVAGKAFAPEEDEVDPQNRQIFKKLVENKFKKVLAHFDIDDAVDTQAMDFLWACMPPHFSKPEADLSAHGNGYRFQNGELKVCPIIGPGTKIRWIRRRAIRLFIDETGPRLVHTMSNNKNSKEDPMVFVQIEDWMVPAATYLFKKHPEFVAVKDLPVDRSIVEKMSFAQVMYDHGLLMTEKALPRED